VVAQSVYAGTTVKKSHIIINPTLENCHNREETHSVIIVDIKGAVADQCFFAQIA
jgi:hypothetical protein